MSKILNFKDLKNKKMKKKYFIYLIFAIIIFYILFSIYLLVRTPSETITVDNGMLTLEESSTGYIIRDEAILKGEN